MAVIYPEDCYDHCHCTTSTNNASCTTTNDIACNRPVGTRASSPHLARKLRRMKRKLLLEFVNQEQQQQMQITSNNINSTRLQVDETREELLAQVRSRGNQSRNYKHDSSFASSSSSSTRMPSLLRLSSSSASSSAFSSSSFSSSASSPMEQDVTVVVPTSHVRVNGDPNNDDVEGDDSGLTSAQSRNSSSRSSTTSSRVSIERRKQQRMKRKMMVEYVKGTTDVTNRLNTMFYAL